MFYLLVLLLNSQSALASVNDSKVRVKLPVEVAECMNGSRPYTDKNSGKFSCPELKSIARAIGKKIRTTILDSGCETYIESRPAVGEWLAGKELVGGELFYSPKVKCKKNKDLGEIKSVVGTSSLVLLKLMIEGSKKDANIEIKLDPALLVDFDDED
jgi:hypothetical protein